MLVSQTTIGRWPLGSDIDCHVSTSDRHVKRFAILPSVFFTPTLKLGFWNRYPIHRKPVPEGFTVRVCWWLWCAWRIVVERRRNMKVVFVFKLCYLWCLFVDVVQRVVLCICVVVVCGPNFVFDGVCALIFFFLWWSLMCWVGNMNIGFFFCGDGPDFGFCFCFVRKPLVVSVVLINFLKRQIVARRGWAWDKYMLGFFSRC